MEQTEREINEKISAWIGKPCTCVTELDSDNIVNGIVEYTTYWGGCDMHSVGGRPTPFATSDRHAIDLLPALVERGYCPELYYTVDSEGFAAWYFSVNPGHEELCFIEQSIARAISMAVVSLIKDE